jgi:hypothetical protein
MYVYIYMSVQGVNEQYIFPKKTKSPPSHFGQLESTRNMESKRKIGRKTDRDKWSYSEMKRGRVETLGDQKEEKRSEREQTVSYIILRFAKNGKRQFTTSLTLVGDWPCGLPFW